VTIKLGKHNTHLSWYDAQNEALRKLVALDKILEPIICERGDADKDGVCDDWDRELDTPLELE
jgi:OOP family OmpA-OmpF porin